MSIFAADHVFDFFEVGAEVIQDACQQHAILDIAVKLVEHLIGIADWCHRLVGPGIRPACPCICTIWDQHPEFQRAEARTCIGVGLQFVLEVLVNRNPHGPPGGCIRSALHITGEEFYPGQQAPNPSHVSITITFDSVVDAAKCKQLVFERSQRFEDSFQLEILAFFLRPEVFGDHSIWAEHEYDSLFFLSQWFPAQAWERQ